MRIIRKLYRIVTGTANDVVDKLDNPLRNARQAVRDLDTQLRRLTQHYAEFNGEYHLIRERISRNTLAAENLSQKAVNAKKLGKLEDAKHALSSLLDVEKNIMADNASAERLEKHVVVLRKERNALQQRYDQCRRQVKELELRHTTADISAKTSNVLMELQAANNNTNFESVLDAIAKEEGKADAFAELAGEPEYLNSDISVHEAEIERRLAEI